MNPSVLPVLTIPCITLFMKVLFHEDGSVKGIATNDVGIAKDGSPKVEAHVSLRNMRICKRRRRISVNKPIILWFERTGALELHIPLKSCPT